MTNAAGVGRHEIETNRHVGLRLFFSDPEYELVNSLTNDLGKFLWKRRLMGLSPEERVALQEIEEELNNLISPPLSMGTQKLTVAESWVLKRTVFITTERRNAGTTIRFK